MTTVSPDGTFREQLPQGDRRIDVDSPEWKTTKLMVEAFEKHCSRTGPSVSKEVYEDIVTSRQCGSSIPMYNPFLNR